MATALLSDVMCIQVVATPLESDVSIEEKLDLLSPMAYFTIPEDYDHAEQSEQEPCK